MSNTCKSCRHWSQDDRESVQWLGSFKPDGFCLGTRASLAGPRLYSVAEIQAYSGIVTSPDFGCALHEARSLTPEKLRRSK